MAETEPREPADGGGPDLPLWELIQTSFVVSRGFQAVFGEAGLSPIQFGVLATLESGEDLSQAELARVLMVRPQSLADVAGGLVERGLVARDGPGGRGRRTALQLTGEGRRILADVWPAVAAFNAPAASGLTAAEAAELVRLLRAVRAALRESG
ncbi:MarR family winged helix-turn-helix transcriptional regulator [Nocardiopsis coralliicola]